MKTPALLLALVLLSLAVFWGYRNAWLPASRLAEQPADFANYHRAAQLLAAGESPYRVHNFDYPPLVGFAMLPFAGLPELTARRLWLGLSLLCLVAAAVLTALLLGGDRSAFGVVVATWAVAGTQAENLVLGQLHPLLLLLLVLSWWGLVRARPALAHGAVALAAGLKLWPALLVAVPALRAGTPRVRLRRLLAGAAAVVLAVCLPWITLCAWPPPHAPVSAGYWMGTPALLSFGLPSVALRVATARSASSTAADQAPDGEARALPAAWVQGNDPRALRLPGWQRLLSVGIAALTLLAGGGYLWRSAARGPESRGLEGRGLLHASAALVALALAASPISWYHYQIFQLPGLALLAHRGWEARRFAYLVALAAITAGLTWSHHFLVGGYVRRHGWTAADPLWLMSASSLVAVLTLVVFALHLRAVRAL